MDSLRACGSQWRSSNYNVVTCLGKVWQIDKFYLLSDIISAPQGMANHIWEPSCPNLSRNAIHTASGLAEAGGNPCIVLDGKCNPLLPPYQFKEVFLNIISLVLCWPLFFSPSRNTLIIMLESWGKVAFMWFLSPKHSIVMGLLICVFTVTWCSPIIVTIMERAGMCFPQD